MESKTYYVYILSNFKNTSLYIGVTNNIEKRVREHKNDLINGFTKKYNITKLVYYEEYRYINDAIKREKQLKNWHREWKVELIESMNPKFPDLAWEWDSPDPETILG